MESVMNGGGLMNGGLLNGLYGGVYLVEYNLMVDNLMECYYLRWYNYGGSLVW
jgi:hypothetical protein